MLHYARVIQCTPNCDINRLRTPQNQIGTAFGTARLNWLSPALMVLHFCGASVQSIIGATANLCN